MRSHLICRPGSPETRLGSTGGCGRPNTRRTGRRGTVQAGFNGRHFCEFSANVALVRTSADRSCASLSRVRQKELVQASRIPARARDVHQMGSLVPNWADSCSICPTDKAIGKNLGRNWEELAHHTHRLGANWEESGKNLHVTQRPGPSWAEPVPSTPPECGWRTSDGCFAPAARMAH